MLNIIDDRNYDDRQREELDRDLNCQNNLNLYGKPSFYDMETQVENLVNNSSKFERLELEIKLKVKKLLETSSLLIESKIPADMIEDDFNYWSRKQFDMDLNVL